VTYDDSRKIRSASSDAREWPHRRSREKIINNNSFIIRLLSTAKTSNFCDSNGNLSLSELRAWHMTRLQKKHNFYVPSLDMRARRDAGEGQGYHRSLPERRAASSSSLARSRAARFIRVAAIMSAPVNIAACRKLPEIFDFPGSAARGRQVAAAAGEPPESSVQPDIHARSSRNARERDDTTISGGGDFSPSPPPFVDNAAVPLASPRRPSSRPLPFSLGIK